ncbi:MAG: energy transducer TonB [Candidatus Marinimicrobia bacterium]|nr:energy transducer TonB [Candidatus Neomarinimicrobiota bacterium]
MNKIKLTISNVILLVAALSVSAEPKVKAECCQPSPVGGIDALKANTQFPVWAQEYDLEGDVLLNFQVDIYGNVSDIQVSESGGDLFDESAIDAVLRTDWNPARQAGDAVAVTYLLPFHFRSK